MKKIFTLFLALAAMTNVFASVKIGDLYYTLNDAELTAYVDEDPANIPPYKSITSVVIPPTVNHNSKTYKVTAIGNNAFNGATSIVSVVVAGNVTMIGHYAFNGCTKLASVILGQGVDTIGIDAFKSCPKLTNVTLHCDKIVSKDYSFASPKLGRLFGEQVTDFTIGDGVTKIGEQAFKECTNIQNITISNSVKQIINEAFRGCTGLTKVTLPNSVERVLYHVFTGCTNLTEPVYNNTIFAYMPPAICPESYTIPEGITEIAGAAFQECSTLQSVTFPQSLKKIQLYAFWKCTSLSSVNFHDNITSVGSHVFTGTNISKPIYNSTLFAYMPPSVCPESYTIPRGIEIIGTDAFENCTALQDVTISDFVTQIYANAFSCSGLKKVTLGRNVVLIGYRSFFGCSHLEEIYNYRQTLDDVTIMTAVFDGNATYPAVDKTTCKLYVPKTSVDLYKEAEVWKDFTNIIGFTPDKVKLGDLYYIPNEEDYTAAVTYDKYHYIGYVNYEGMINADVPSEVTYAGEKYAVTSIGGVAFANCGALKTVTLHEGLKKIEKSAFSNCPQLESIDIPAGVEVIEEGAFSGCTAMKSVTIPESVTKIREWVFYCCSSLTQITNYAVTPQDIFADVFEGTEARPAVDKTKCKLYVPEASVEAYKAKDVWKDFGDNIIGIKDPQGINTPSLQGRSGEASKFIRDGQLLIEKNGKTYNAQGVEIK